MSCYDDYDGNCEYCKHYQSSICITCMHFEEDPREDLFEEAHPAIIKARQEAERKKMLDSLVAERLEVNLSADFVDAHQRAKLVVSNDICRPKFMAVHATNTHLIACDTYRTVELKCEIPEALQQKDIVQIECLDTRAGFFQVAIADDQKYPDMSNLAWNPEKWVDGLSVKGIDMERLR